jgi:hypothetical protein
VNMAYGFVEETKDDPPVSGCDEPVDDGSTRQRLYPAILRHSARRNRRDKAAVRIMG